MRAALIGFLFCVGCHDHEHEGFDTYQACFDDHHGGAENLPVKEAIVVCCLEHPIAGHTEVCGNSAAECMTYLGTNLMASSATSTEVTEACADYVTQKGM